MKMTITEKYIDFGGNVYFFTKIDGMPMNKDTAFLHSISVICRGWSFQRLTDDEKQTLISILRDAKVIGNFWQRTEQYYQIQHAFLRGLGYKPIGWRETA